MTSSNPRRVRKEKDSFRTVIPTTTLTAGSRVLMIAEVWASVYRTPILKNRVPNMPITALASAIQAQPERETAAMK